MITVKSAAGLVSIAAVLSLLFPAPLSAQETGGSGSVEIEAGTTYDKLTNNYDDWWSRYLVVTKKFTRRQALYGSARETSRFNLRDSELMVGYYHPIDKNLSGHVEASSSSTHRVLPKSSIFGELIRSLKGGWVVNLGFRRTEYDNARINLGIFTGEKYWGNYHAAYSLYYSNLEPNGYAQSHAVIFNYFYTDTSRIGAAVAKGQELENLGPGRGVLKSDVFNLSVTGRHQLDPKWSVGYGASYHEQGRSYLKRGYQVGIRYIF